MRRHSYPCSGRWSGAGPSRTATGFRSRAIVLAMGVTYRRLEASGIEEFIGRGVFYTPAVAEAPWLKGCPVVIVGGGNSVGQAAVHLYRGIRRYSTRCAGPITGGKHVRLPSCELFRGADNVVVRFESEIVSVTGDDRLERVTVRIARADGVDEMDARGLFVLIGSEPHTNWLASELARDEWGFILTGAEAGMALSLELTMPGVATVGDVRRGSVTRLASQVGCWGRGQSLSNSSTGSWPCLPRARGAQHDSCRPVR